MTERARQSNASRRQERSVADYIVHRLAKEGIDHCFGVEIVGGRMDLPPALAFAHKRLGEMYGETPSMTH